MDAERLRGNLPVRQPADLVRSLRARATFITGEKWEADATKAMMREAADMLERRSSQPPAVPADVAEAAKQWETMKALGRRHNWDEGGEQPIPLDVYFSQAFDELYEARASLAAAPAGGEEIDRSDVPDSPPDWSFDAVNHWVHSGPEYEYLQCCCLSLATALEKAAPPADRPTEDACVAAAYRAGQLAMRERAADICLSVSTIDMSPRDAGAVRAAADRIRSLEPQGREGTDDRTCILARDALRRAGRDKGAV